MSYPNFTIRKLSFFIDFKYLFVTFDFKLFCEIKFQLILILIIIIKFSILKQEKKYKKRIRDIFLLSY